MRPSRSQVSRRATGQVSAREPRPISTSRQPVLPRMVRRAPSGKISIQPEPSSVWPDPQSSPTISERLRPPANPIARIARSRRPRQIHVQRRQHGEQFVGKNRGFLEGRAGVAPADAGQDGGDMPVTDVQWFAELPVAPGDAGQPSLEGRNRKLRSAAFDLRGEIEADRFRVGRRLRKTLAAQPGGEHFPVRGVGALGVVGLRRAGVGLGGLRQRRQAAAEAWGAGLRVPVGRMLGRRSAAGRALATQGHLVFAPSYHPASSARAKRRLAPPPGAPGGSVAEGIRTRLAQARGRASRAGGPSLLGAGATFSDASSRPATAVKCLPGAPEGFRAGFPAFSMGLRARFQSMSDKASLSDIATPRQAGRIMR